MKKGVKASQTETRRRVTFQVVANPKSEVYVAGTFNSWNPTQHQMKDTRGNGKYTITLMLPKGVYEYKFVINNNWHVDPECKNWVRNPFGTLNSMISVE